MKRFKHWTNNGYALITINGILGVVLNAVADIACTDHYMTHLNIYGSFAIFYHALFQLSLNAYLDNHDRRLFYRFIHEYDKGVLFIQSLDIFYHYHTVAFFCRNLTPAQKQTTSWRN